MLVVALGSLAFAHSSGQTGTSTTGCGPCHGGTDSAGTVVTLSSTGATTVAPGDVVSLELVVANAGSSYTGAGLDVSVTGGRLAAGVNNWLSGREITHTSTARGGSGPVAATPKRPPGA
jgi:hypothetical protein